MKFRANYYKLADLTRQAQDPTFRAPVHEIRFTPMDDDTRTLEQIAEWTVHHIGAAQYPVIAGVYGVREPDVSRQTNDAREARET